MHENLLANVKLLVLMNARFYLSFKLPSYFQYKNLKIDET